MASPSFAGDSGPNDVAREFLRALNVLLKSSRLYGLKHSLSQAQLKEAWNRLQSLQAAHAGVRIGVAGQKLLLNGELSQLGPVEQTFVQLLTSMGLSSIEFSGSATAEGLLALAEILAGAKPETLQKTVEANAARLAGISVNRVRFLAHSGSWTPDDGQAGGTAAAPPAPAATGPGSGGSSSLLAEVLPGAPVPEAPSPQPSPENENAVRWIVELSRRLDALAAAGEQPPAAPLDDNNKLLLERLLARGAAVTSSSDSDRAALVALAEHLAIRYASESFQRGETQGSGIHKLLAGFGKEIAELRAALSSQQDKLARAGIAASEEAESLDRKFWANVPERGKLQVLLSADAWCIPHYNVQSFVAELLERGDAALAADVLRSYGACVALADPEARRRTASGLTELVDTLCAAGADPATTAAQQITRQLLAEPDPDVQPVLSSALLRLVQESSSRRIYRPLELALALLNHLEKDHPALAKSLRPRLRVDNRLPEFIRDAIRSERCPDGLMQVLRRSPEASLAAVVAEFGRSSRRNDCARLAELTRGLGDSAVDRLADTLRTGSPADAVATVGLLAALSMPVLTQHLPHRLQAWPVSHQASALRQIDASAHPQRGALFAALLNVVNPAVLPLVVDELGFDSDSAVSHHLLAIASSNDSSPFLRVKAIESLARLREPGAVEMLRSLVLARKLIGWHHHDELRLTAFHALCQIQPALRHDPALASSFKPRDLELVPHRSDSVQEWSRQRRYPRVVPQRTLQAQASTSRGAVTVVVEKLSLGGGLALRNSHAQLGADGVIEVQTGLRRFRARVLLQELGARRVAFEFTDMSLDDRWRLRQLLNEPLSGAIAEVTLSPEAVPLPPPSDPATLGAHPGR